MALFDWKTVTVCLSLLCLPILLTFSVLALPLILVLYLIAWAVHLKFAQTVNLPYYPSHVFKINLVLADYFFSTISLTPQILTYFIWRYWKSGPSSGSEGVLRDVPYKNDGHKDHTLDLYLPVSVQTSTVNKVSAPIIVFVHGGSWFTGSKNHYGLLADMIRRMGYIVVVPDYRKYPLVKAQGMYDDLRLVLEFVGDKAESWGGDLERIFVAGHSAGAQIASQVVLSAAVDEARARAADVAAAAGSTPSFKINGHPNGMPRMPRIEGLLLMAGVYDIASHYEFETARGVELISAMGRAMGGTPESFAQNSPLHLLPSSHNTAEINGNINGHGNGHINGHGNGHSNGHNGNINGSVNGNGNGYEHNHGSDNERKEEDIEVEAAAMSKCLAETMPRMMFVHGEKDTMVPVSSTVDFYKAIGGAIRAEDRDEVDVRVRLYKRMGHNDVITALMSNYFFRNRSTGSLVSDLKDFIEPESFEDDS